MGVLRPSTAQHKYSRLAVYVLLALVHCTAPASPRKQGFVYCPAYPCVCESDNGALVINCQYLYLTNLPKFLAFDGRIRTLSLRQNSIRQLPARSFSGLHVEDIDLTDNVISHVHEDAFEGLENSLEKLRLQVYAMEGIPSTALRGLQRLRMLKIIGCKVDSLTATSLGGLTQLQELYLQGCRIKEIDAGSLAPLKRLQVLDLSGNSLQPHHLAEVGKLYELRKLVLSGNNISRLSDRVFDHLLNLRHLDLSHNHMQYIDVAVLKPLHYSLEVLKLHANLLTEEVFQALQDLRTLRHLAMSSNNITSVPAGCLHRQEFLAQLELSDNDIVELNKLALKGTEKYLQILRLDNNPLSTLHNNTFRDHSRLKQLFLDKTDLGGNLHDEIFRGVEQSLRKVIVSSSNLTTLDLFAFSKMYTLEELGVSGNNITQVPEGIFERLRKLKKLDLSKNSIQNLPEGAFSGLETSLESIDLHDNHLRTISGCVFHDFQRLGDLRLRGNPLTCDCRLAWLHHRMQMTLPEYHRSLLQWHCAAPEALLGRPFGTLYMADLQCPANGTLVLDECSVNRSSSALDFQESPTVIDAIASPLLPLDMMGTTLELYVQSLGGTALLAVWNVTSTATVTGFRFLLRRGNDSAEEADVTLRVEVTHYVLSGLLDQCVYETCVTVLGEKSLPMARDCVETTTGNHSTHSPALDEMNREAYMLPISFTTLLWSYVSGCIVASTLCVILAFVVRRSRRRHRRLNKCQLGFHPGYSAWTGTRYSVPSTTTATSSCYFNAPSVGSCDDDGLEVTIGGIDNNHSVEEGTNARPEEMSTRTSEGDDDGDGETEDGLRGSVGELSTLGVSGVEMSRALVAEPRFGLGESSFTTYGRRSTVSSFRRHLPANYIVTSADVAEDFFFHF